VISPIQPPAIGAIETAAPRPTTGPALGDAFGKVLSEASSAEKASTTAADAFAAGDPSIGIHEVMIAAEKANLAVRFATTLKNKALESYRELMNTQV
jgi:flagellar hook-basal body complex protein FliE